MRRRGLNIRKALLRIILPAVRKLPPKAASRFVAGIGRTEYALGRQLRVRFDEAVTRGASYFGAPWDVRSVSRDLAGNQIRWRTRDQLLDGVPGERVASLFQVEGREHLEAAKAEGRGVVLLANHYGSHLMPAHWLVREGFPLRLFMERPHHVSRLLTQEFETDGPLGQKKLFISRKANPTEAAGSILRAGRVLKAGMVVMIASDVRWEAGVTSEAQFLGSRYRFSATWVMLAALTGAPVVPVFCRMEADGANHLEFLPPFHVESDGAKPGRIERYVQPCIAAIEERVRLHPENSNEYLFWDEPALA